MSVIKRWVFSGILNSQLMLGAFTNSLATDVDNKAGLKRQFGISSRNLWRNRIKIVFSAIYLSQAVAHHDIVPS